MTDIISETSSLQGSKSLQVEESSASTLSRGERLVPEEIGNDSGGQKFLDVHLRHYETAARYVSGKRVLDIACGSGYGSQMLRQAGASTVLGVDLFPEIVQYAKEHYQSSGVEFICADAEEFEWSEKFDVVISFETVEHLQHPSKFLERVRNLLVPNGDFLLSVPLGETRHFDPYHLHAFSQRQVFTLLEKAGFYVELYRCDPLFLNRSELLTIGKQLPDSNRRINQLLFNSRSWRILYDFVFRGGFNMPTLLVVSRLTSSHTFGNS